MATWHSTAATIWSASPFPRGCASLDKTSFRTAWHSTPCTTPPTLASNAFSNVQSLTVLVPCQSAGSYLAAESWSALTIEEHCPAGIAATAAAMVTVTTTGGGILISGGEGQHFFVSDIIGHRVTESNGGFVALPAHGIYFVSTMGMRTHKVVY